MKKIISILAACLAIAGCAGAPIEAVPVENFKADRYLGTWYEIARLDHSFERGLSNVTATYSRREDGKIKVLNKGFNDKKGKFKNAVGKAKFAKNENTGHLKVSFFGPFYGDYIIFDLKSDDYSRAFVSGGSDKYLWLLSRTSKISEQDKADFIAASKALGYDTDTLIWIDHSKSE